MQEIELQNGTVLEFPADMPQDQMRQAIYKQFPEYAPKTQPGYGEQALETMKSVGRVYPAMETVANVATSAYGVPLSGLASLFAAPWGLGAMEKTRQAVEKALVYQPQTESGQQLMQAATYPFQKYEEGVGYVGEKIEEAGYPHLAATVHTAGSAAPAVIGTKAALKKPTSLDAKTKALVDKGVNKAVRPSVSGKGTAAQRRKYFSDAKTAIEEIVSNKENLDLRNEFGERTGKLPQTLDEFTQAIEQTKKGVFEQYDALAKTAEGNIDINLNKTANKLNAVMNSKALRDMSPETIKYAEGRLEALKGRGKYTAVEAQEAIQILNQSLEKFYRDPSPANKGQALVDSLIANDLRKQMDTSITKATGKGYGELKKKYGALKAIEQDVNKRAIVDARKNVKGLLDFSDVFTGGHVISGMLRAEPATAAAGLTSKGIASYYKMLNDPNKIIKTMFSEVEKAARPVKSKIAAAPAGIAITELSQRDYDDNINNQ